MDAGLRAGSGPLSLVVPASAEGVRQASDGLERFTQAHGLDATVTWPFHVALDEVLSNTVRWGHGGDTDQHEIEIQASLQQGALVLSVVDDAPPFNPLETPEPDVTRPLEERPVGGLGILVVRKLMDAITYERREGRNWLVLTRRVDG
ncbi:MAG TPA: ATP-binding protein [Vicinamibacteria bacterium]|nr:ATP-binding protein [Vicinamibacteria bacterium]